MITETSDLAADLLILAARDRGIRIIRFNQDEFPGRISIRWESAGETRFYSNYFAFAQSDIAGAWFRRTVQRLDYYQHDNVTSFAARESEGYLGGIWETAPWFWMNNPSAARRAEYKLLQLRQAQVLGLTIPLTLVSNDAGAIRDFVQRQDSAIAKTVVGGRLSIEGSKYAVFTTPIGAMDIDDDHQIAASPAIYQSQIETQFDLRVTVVGDRVFAARIVLQDRTENEVDWRKADPRRLHYERHLLPAGLEATCAQLVAAMGLTYGALDFVVTPEGEHVFLELNPAGQWGWIERALGVPITEAILDRLREGLRSL